LFRGISSINLDGKGRLAIPARYRAEIQDSCACQMIVSIALNTKFLPEKGCLWLYPLSEWEIIEEKINNMPSMKKKVADLQRFFVGGATPCDMDAQGRLLIPEIMKNKVGLEKQTTLVGHGKKFEIWNESIWAELESTWFSGTDDSKDGLEDIADLSL
jgi:MraZ protein